MPITEAGLAALGTQLLWAALGLGIAFGAIAQRTHFCTMGAVADIANTGDWSRMRMWMLAAAVAALGFNGMVALGWVQASDSVYGGRTVLWASHLLGGTLFGFGMVLASGCGSKTLVRVGGGSLKSVVVFLVMAFSAYATMRGVLAVARVNSIDTWSFTLPAGQDLPSLLAHATGWARPVTAAVGMVMALAVIAGVLLRRQPDEQHVLSAGLGLGAVVVAAWWVSGVWGYVPEHPVTMERSFVGTPTRGMEALSFVAPTAYTVDWLILFSDTSKRLTMAVVLVLGVVLGSAAVALATGSFRWEGFAGTEDTANHLVGGLMMGCGGVTALGCTVGQGLSGISTLSLGSFIALGGILGGAWLGVRYLAWRVERLL
jgi:uncharacterized protein